ncbi:MULTISPECIES: hypothetical protein [unclassified Sphingomonas]|uniref:hypothetical protein n=1 Tax=unclassified Sphingomonas TaxID=196159 RepID=UPI000700266A|nr:MULTISPECIES: hypothetical protein [unclassified Sphingomonas]KQM96466.1 hypothetical protein ASE78_10620 [Sphingomonas sp. Leaf25]KQN35709.1 hypothetical protein ASE97_14700 [Sphingomonas sp. Leaf42]KQT26577.1 hypothetical protein ASG37_15445 [Sphingomonas sp. Leaf407]
MKTMMKAAGMAGLLMLGACGGNADDKAADNIEAMTENRADALEDQADLTSNEQVEDALEDRAENVREMGEDAAEKADDDDNAQIEQAVANRM